MSKNPKKQVEQLFSDAPAPASMKGEPLPDPSRVAQKLIVERSLSSKIATATQNRLIPQDKDGEPTLF